MGGIYLMGLWQSAVSLVTNCGSNVRILFGYGLDSSRICSLEVLSISYPLSLCTAFLIQFSFLNLCLALNCKGQGYQSLNQSQFHHSIFLLLQAYCSSSLLNAEQDSSINPISFSVKGTDQNKISATHFHTHSPSSVDVSAWETSSNQLKLLLPSSTSCVRDTSFTFSLSESSFSSESESPMDVSLLVPSSQQSHVCVSKHVGSCLLIRQADFWVRLHETNAAVLFLCQIEPWTIFLLLMVVSYVLSNKLLNCLIIYTIPTFQQV